MKTEEINENLHPAIMRLEKSFNELSEDNSPQLYSRMHHRHNRS
jgi:hypothetical protein